MCFQNWSRFFFQFKGIVMKLVTGETWPYAPRGQQCHWGSWKVTANDFEVCKPSSSSTLHSSCIYVNIWLCRSSPHPHRPRSPHQPLPYLLCSAQNLQANWQFTGWNHVGSLVSDGFTSSHSTPPLDFPWLHMPYIIRTSFPLPSAASVATPSRSR